MVTDSLKAYLDIYNALMSLGSPTSQFSITGEPSTSHCIPKSVSRQLSHTVMVGCAAPSWKRPLVLERNAAGRPRGKNPKSSQHYRRASRGPLRHRGHLVWSRPATLAGGWLTDTQWVHWVCPWGCRRWSRGQPCPAGPMRQRDADITDCQPMALKLIALQ